MKPCSEAEKNQVDTKLKELANNSPEVLIIAGTIYWKRESDGALYNTLLKYCSTIKLNATDNPYHKKIWPNQEVKTAKQYGNPKMKDEVGDPYTRFRFGAWDCIVQICADCGCELPPPKPDVLTMVGLAAGKFPTDMTQTGVAVRCDGMGSYAVIDAFSERGKVKEEGGTNLSFAHVSKEGLVTQ